MAIFDVETIELKLEKYFPLLKEMAIDSFNEFKKICTEKFTLYSATTRAQMVRDHFKKHLYTSGIFNNDSNFLEESNNTFYMHLEGYPVTFNKLDEDKRKSKFIDTSYSCTDHTYGFEQLYLFPVDISICRDQVTKETPLTFGYILNSIGTEIIGLYLTYQIGKTVLWYRKIDIIIPLPIDNNDDDGKTKHIKRVK